MRADEIMATRVCMGGKRPWLCDNGRGDVLEQLYVDE